MSISLDKLTKNRDLIELSFYHDPHHSHYRRYGHQYDHEYLVFDWMKAKPLSFHLAFVTNRWFSPNQIRKNLSEKVYWIGRKLGYLNILFSTIENFGNMLNVRWLILSVFRNRIFDSEKFISNLMNKKTIEHTILEFRVDTTSIHQSFVFTSWSIS